MVGYEMRLQHQFGCSRDRRCTETKMPHVSIVTRSSINSQKNEMPVPSRKIMLSIGEGFVTSQLSEVHLTESQSPQAWYFEILWRNFRARVASKSQVLRLEMQFGYCVQHGHRSVKTSYPRISTSNATPILAAGQTVDTPTAILLLG
ncbi:hypothetical protein PHYPSEUDO_004048 [Phytophthora pseudosyringae]|uniref:Uncharacterized protein n=1 Tax=Phytophthora pseudosyringae TaxID=221518 RepID=A0A8T1VU75_9STRA|nr:hypothetical protein PHYPSEUDO_004048 [Phytophthora pseudosyringae]